MPIDGSVESLQNGSRTPRTMNFRLALQRYPFTFTLLLLVLLGTGYRAWLYELPAQKPQRHLLDTACDALGYSYHFFLLMFDTTLSKPTSDLHARMALQYKPQDNELRRYAPAEKPAHK